MNRSLNWSFRKEEFRRIDLENRSLLKRLAETNSKYNTMRFKHEFSKHKDYLNNIRLNKTQIKMRAYSITPMSMNQNVKDPMIKSQN